MLGTTLSYRHSNRAAARTALADRSTASIERNPVGDEMAVVVSPILCFTCAGVSDKRYHNNNLCSKGLGERSPLGCGRGLDRSVDLSPYRVRGWKLLVIPGLMCWRLWSSRSWGRCRQWGCSGNERSGYPTWCYSWSCTL